MNTVLAIALGGGFGAATRHYAILLVTQLFGQDFPYGTLFVNVLGSFLIGAILETLALKYDLPLEIKAFLVTGFLGGFTTFSTFSLDVFKLAETGAYVSSIVYVLSSVLISIMAIFLAVYIVRGVVN